MHAAVESEARNKRGVAVIFEIDQQGRYAGRLPPEGHSLKWLIGAPQEVEHFGGLHLVRIRREAHGSHHGRDVRQPMVAFLLLLCDMWCLKPRAGLLNHLLLVLDTFLVLLDEFLR